MDTLTHAMSGTLLACATAPSEPRGDQLTLRERALAGTLAAAFLDSDFILRWITDLLTYLNLHRGITHSLVMLPLWGAFVATFLWWAWNKQKPWRTYLGVSLLGISVHIAGDVITAYGTQLFAPLSSYKAAWPTTFIIDPWFTGIIILGLWGSWRWPRSRLPAVAGLAVLVTYIGFQGILRIQALALGYEYAHQQQLEIIQLHALPQPLSPFNWKLVVVTPKEYHVSQVNLRRQRPTAPLSSEAPVWIQLYAAYPPVGAMHWTRYPHPKQETLARTVWQQEVLRDYRRFALLPTLYAVEENADCLCVWFVDLRFTLPSLTPPFRYGGCRQGEDSGWELRHLSGNLES
jgi:inner membrane protein